jgi:hypothetical protein
VTLQFVAYAVPDLPPLEIIPAARSRQGATPMQALCLPMACANTLGWAILNDCDFTASWDGCAEPGGVSITSDGRPTVVPNFGGGHLTWFVPYMFRLPAGWDLLVMPPANVVKDGIGGLSGLVEADHTVCGLSIVWRISRPYHPVNFAAGEPIAQILPQRRADLEQFQPEVRDLRDEPELAGEYLAWRRQRMKLITAKHGQTITPKDADKSYLRQAEQRRLHLQPFVDRRGER